MNVSVSASQSLGRLFARYAAISLVPMVMLGIVLSSNLRSEAARRGLAEGKSEAVLVARTAVEPLLDGGSLAHGLSTSELTGLRRLATAAISEGHLLRLRVRDLTGRVVFSDDGSGFGGRPEDEALEAAAGQTVGHLTRLNSDTNDSGRKGVESVEIYLPLQAGRPSRRVGVLETYLPYAPIAQDITGGLNKLYVDLAVGLALVYLALLAITVSMSRSLRREINRNAFLAEHDTLTELPNRVLFHRRAERALADASRRGEATSIAIVDLDHFKEINDTLGHHSGDELLTEIARAISSSMRPGDTVARLGGDEFGLILRNVADARPLLSRIREIVEREVDIRGLPLSVQASVGFSVAPDDGTDVNLLLQRADIAMYVAKATHAEVVGYDDDLDHYDATKLSLVGELRRAIDQGQLVLHFQPQARIATREVMAVEALVRWQHPEHGLLPPDRFLPLAEQTDVIDRLTDWVLHSALQTLRVLDGSSPRTLKVAVNVSARSVCRSDFARRVIQTLHDLDIPAERLIIEVTESALLTDPGRAAKVLDELSKAGVKISIDDFGQGQTSLGYLSALPVDELKIDKSFVMDMLQNPDHAAIARSIIDLGHNLKLRVVGEGVESDEILDALQTAGCDVAQGFSLARPMALEVLVDWLTAREVAEHTLDLASV